MDFYFLILTAINLFILIMFVVTVLNNSVMGYSQRNYFFVSGILCSIICILEVVTYLVDGTDVRYRFLNYFSNYCGFAFSPLLTVFLGNAILGNDILKSNTLKILFTCWCVYVLWLFISLFFDASVFYIDANNNYSRGPFFFIYVVYYTGGIVYLLLETVRLTLKYQYKNNIILYLIIIFFCFGTSVQVIIPTVHVTWFCIIFAMIFYYIYGTELLQYIDKQTSLLNYNSFLRSFRKVKNKSVLVVFEIDNFRKLIQTYGRNTADLLLSEIAKSLRDNYSSLGLCFRISSDEFAVIVSNPSLDFEQLNKDYYMSLLRKSIQVNELPLVAIGYATFDKHDTLDDVLSAADVKTLEFQKKRVSFLK